MNGISDILERYGTSLKETRKLVGELVPAIAKKEKGFLKTPQFLTPDEIKGFGLVTEAGEPFTLEQGWMLKLTPVEGAEPTISYITPEKWEITQDQVYISPEGQRFTREEIEAQLVAPEIPLEVEQVFGKVFPTVEDAGQVLSWVAESEENLDTFLELISRIGRTEDTEALLQQMGATEEQVEEFFAPLPTVEPEREEWKWKDVWDAVYAGAAQMWQQTKGYFFSDLPNLIWKDIVPSKEATPEQLQAVAEVNEISKKTRDKFRRLYVKHKSEYEEWVAEHPELKPRAEWEGLVIERLKQDPSLILDPAYIAYIAADSAAFMAAFWGATATVGLATKNPYLGMAAGVAVTTPAQSHDLYEDLLESGATEEQAAQLAVPIGAAIASVEVIGGIAVLRAMGAIPGLNLFYKLLRRNLGRELGKRTLAAMAARGLLSATDIQLSEIFEEILQGAIHNAVVKTFDESREVLAGVAETAVRTWLATLPLGLLGGGVSMSRVPPSEANKLTPEQKQTQGWQQEEETGDWLKPEAIPSQEDITKDIKEVLMTLPDSEKVISGVMVDTWHRKLLREVAKLPPTRKLIEWGLGKRILVKRWSETIEDIMGRGRFLHSEISRRGEGAQALTYWRLFNTIPNDIKYFGFSKDIKDKAFSAKMFRRLLPQYKATPEAGTFEHIYTHPEMYNWKGMEKGLEYVTKVHKINTLIRNMLVEEGVAEEIVSNDWWVHRVVYGKFDPNEELHKVRGKPGVKRGGIKAKASFEMHRKAPTMAEGIAWGIAYGRSASESISTYIEGAFKKIADARFEKYVAKELEPLAQMGVLPTEELLRKYPEVVERAIITAEELADTNSFVDKINRAIRGERLPEQTLRAIERRFPELGRKLRALVQEPIRAESQLRELLAQNEKIIRRLKARVEKAEAIDIEAIKAEARAEAVRIGIPDEQKLTEAFRLMEYEDRLAFRSTMESQLPEIEKVIGEQQFELGGIQEFLETDLVATYRGHIGKREVSLMAVLKKGQFPESFTVQEAEMLMMGKKPKTVIKGRVPRAVVIDELADHFKMSEQELIDHIEFIASQKTTAEDLKFLVSMADDRYKGIKRMLKILDDVDTRPEFIPKAEPGMPEAGMQQDIFGYETPVFPKGKGIVTQISMDDYGRLVELHEKEGLPPPNVVIKPKIEGVKGFEAETQIAQVTYEVPPIKSATERKAALETLKKEVKALAEARRVPFWEARRERAFRMEQIRQPGIEEGYIMQPFAGGRKFDQELIDAFNKFFGHDAGLSALRVTADTAGMLRILKAALDWSQTAIQGTLAWGLFHSYLMTNPKRGVKLVGAWYYSFFLQVGAFFNPGITAKFMEKHRDAISRRIAAGGTARAVFMFQEMQATVGKGTLARWGEKGLAMIPFDPYHRAETSFFTGGEIVRDIGWEIFEPDAIKNGKEAELAHFLDILTGIGDPRAMGVPLTIRQMEQSWIFFSSAYTRSYLTVVADIFRGGMTGALARRAIAGFVVAGAAYFTGIQYAISTLMGKDDDEAWEDVRRGFGIEIDPITGNWEWRPTAAMMSLKIGDTYFGIGGGIYGLMRLAGNIAATIAEVGERERIDLIRIMKHGSLNKRDNPWIAWWYPRSSALFSPIYEMATHRDFLGYPIETPEEYARYIISLLEPIWVEQSINPLIPGMAGNREVPEDALETAMWIIGELFGLRVNPEYTWQSFYNKANEYISLMSEDKLEDWQKEAWRQGKLKWKHLTPPQQTKLLKNNPELYEVYKEAQADSDLRTGSHWKAWEGSQKKTKDIYYDRGNELWERLISGELDTRELREMWSEAGRNYGASLATIKRDEHYEWVYDFFDRKRAKGVKYLEEAFFALAEYQEVMFAEYVDEKGDIDWDAKDRAIDAWIETWGEDYYGIIREMYADEKLLAGLPPSLVRLADDKEKLGRGYWRLPFKPIIEMDEGDEVEGNIPNEYHALWREYQTLETDAEREAFINRHPDMAKDWRAEFRLAHPEDDARLALWGYGGKLQSPEAYDLVVQWGRELGIPLEQVGLGLPPHSLIENYFEYNQIATQLSGNSAEAKLWRLEHPEFTNWAMENWGWEGAKDYRGMEYYRLQIKWRNEQTEYDALEDKGTREQYLVAHPEFRDDRRRLEALGYEIPEDLIETYVEYYKMPRAGYEDDWFLMEHPEFYKIAKELLGWEERDFSKVPTRKEASLLEYYDKLSTGTPRLKARCSDKDLDAALVKIRGLKPAYGTDRCLGAGVAKPEGEELSPWEKAAEAQKIKEWIEG